MRFPSLKAVASQLRRSAKFIGWCSDKHQHTEECNYCDVRLQVYLDGAWAVRVGPSDYDFDHRGAWGASCIPRERFNARDLARELLAQAREDAAR